MKLVKMPSESAICSPRINGDVEAINIAYFQDVKGSKNSESPTETTTTLSSHSTSQDSDITSDISSPSPNKSNSSSESPTFRERLRSARKLIPQYPRRARLLFSTGDSEHVFKDETRIKPKTQRCDDFRSFFREHYIFSEYKSLCTNHQSGVYIMPSLKSLQVWHGIIFLRAGPYRDGIFRFFVFLPDDFPDSRPLLKFTTPVFHPQIHPNGVLNLDIAFPTWQKGKDSVWQIIKFMKSCFYNADTWGATNQAARNVMHNSLEEFIKKAGDCSLQSQILYDKEMESEYSVVMNHSAFSMEPHTQSQDNNFLNVVNLDDGNFLKVKKMTQEEFAERRKQMMQGKLPSSRSCASH